ncbi:MAG: Sapep family Mn(2+)-dependent dipeptidase [Oscillospiraceae bacterium]|nr:Sapep family Mn(2+)-dependent dipeptidase [Oscillospiraceae bacterium]
MTLKQQIHNWMEGREDEFVEALAPLVAINSITGPAAPGMPFGPGPAKALELALELARKWGMTTWDDDGYVGLADLNDKEDILHILAHLDIVAAGDHWDTDPFTLVRDGDLIYGRGTDDDKGPAVASLLAMRCIKELGIPMKGNVKMILGTDEESGSSDLMHYFARHPFAPHSITPDTCFPVTNIEKAGYAPKFSQVWDAQTPAEAQLIGIHGGIRVNVAPGNCTAVIRNLSAEVAAPVLEAVASATGVRFSCSESEELLTLEATGEQAHASRPDDGKNAITAMLEVLHKLPLHNDPAAQAVRDLNRLFPYGDNGGQALGIAMEDAVSGKLTLTLSLMDLDETGFHAQFDSRDPLCATPDNTKAVVEKVFSDLGWQCCGEFHPAHAVDENSPFIQILLETYEEFSGRKGYCEAIGGGTYVHHIPGGVAFGAGEHDFVSNVHSANERAKISQLLLTAEIYAAVIARICGDDV